LRPEHDFSLTTIPQFVLDPQSAETNKETVIDLSRQTYGTLKEEVEKQLETLQ
jgi:hypothetical protein